MCTTLHQHCVHAKLKHTQKQYKSSLECIFHVVFRLLHSACLLRIQLAKYGYVPYHAMLCYAPHLICMCLAVKLGMYTCTITILLKASVSTCDCMLALCKLLTSTCCELHHHIVPHHNMQYSTPHHTTLVSKLHNIASHIMNQNIMLHPMPHTTL